MYLTYRPARLQDLPDCVDCLRDHFAYDADAKRELTHLWGQWLREGTSQVAVIEDRDFPGGRKIVWLCYRVFLTNEFAEKLKQGVVPPFASRHIVDLCLRGESPVLSAGQLAEGAAPNGLNLYVMSSGALPGYLNDETLPQFADTVAEFNYFTTGGYRLKEILLEMYDEFTFCWAIGGGYHLRHDHADDFAATNRYNVALPPGALPPRLYGVNIDEGRIQLPVTMTSASWRGDVPRFGFSPAEQEMLLFSIWHDSDEEIARMINVAVVTVKKRWASIYRRVAAVAPELLGLSPDFDLDEIAVGAQRGSEKRHRLINYLRQHIEELRPAAVARRPVAGDAPPITPHAAPSVYRQPGSGGGVRRTRTPVRAKEPSRV